VNSRLFGDPPMRREATFRYVDTRLNAAMKTQFLSNNKETKELRHAVLLLKNADEAARFFRDLLTPEEIREFGRRWSAAQLIDKGVSYRTVARQTGLSTATITRVARWLKKGMGGYALVLKRLKR